MYYILSCVLIMVRILFIRINGFTFFIEASCYMMPMVRSKNGPLVHNKVARAKHRQPTLEISKECELVTYLGYWLSMFVLPSNNSRIIPETFCMACVMAKGIDEGFSCPLSIG